MHQISFQRSVARIGMPEPWPEDAVLYQTLPDEQIIFSDMANVLAVKTFLKMLGLPFTIIHRVNAAEMSPTGQVPCLKVGKFVVSDFSKIVSFVNLKGFYLDSELRDEQKTEMNAYMDLINNHLINALLFVTWCDPLTYNMETRERFGCMFSWPLNIILPFLKKREVYNKLASIGWGKKSLINVYSEMKDCFSALNERLSDQKYFFGDRPTQLDAVTFGCLHTILTKKPVNSPIHNTLKSYLNLVEFCNRISNHYDLEPYVPNLGPWAVQN